MDTNSSRFTMIRGTLQIMKKNAMVNSILAFLASSRFAEMKIFRCIDVVTHMLNEYNCLFDLVDLYAYIEYLYLTRSLSVNW